MEPQFDTWNSIKKNIQAESNEVIAFPKEGEVWMSAVGLNIGYEQNGGGKNFSRPVLIIKKFNNHMFWCVPLSTKQKTFDFYYNYVDPDNQAVSAILAQMKLASIKRLKRKLYEIAPGQLLEIKQIMQGFLE
jgi:mRNA interferase MazF